MGWALKILTEICDELYDKYSTTFWGLPVTKGPERQGGSDAPDLGAVAGLPWL